MLPLCFFVSGCILLSILVFVSRMFFTWKKPRLCNRSWYQILKSLCLCIGTVNVREWNFLESCGKSILLGKYKSLSEKTKKMIVFHSRTFTVPILAVNAGQEAVIFLKFTYGIIFSNLVAYYVWKLSISTPVNFPTYRPIDNDFA